MTFALITEGVSEYRVISHIITKYFKEQDPEIRQIQPKITGEKQASIGGWPEVLKYCERTEELKNIFADNDYLVIQIDTDQSQTSPFNISHINSDNTLKSVEELYTDVAEKLIRLIDPAIRDSHSNKIFFAICIHTIECWLLPVYYANRHQSDTRNCITTLNQELKRNNIQPLPGTGKNSPNSIRTYETVLKNWRKRNDIKDAAKHNAGFLKFTASLDTIIPT